MPVRVIVNLKLMHARMIRNVKRLCHAFMLVKDMVVLLKNVKSILKIKMLRNFLSVPIVVSLLLVNNLID